MKYNLQDIHYTNYNYIPKNQAAIQKNIQKNNNNQKRKKAKMQKKKTKKQLEKKQSGKTPETIKVLSFVETLSTISCF